jgi:hypothetical protein
MGLELTRIEKFRDILGWLWVLSWIAILLGFIVVGVWISKVLLSVGNSGAWYCLAILAVTVALWVLFFYFDSKAPRGAPGEKAPRAVLLVWISGSALTILTFLGILFFLYIAPKFP